MRRIGLAFLSLLFFACVDADLKLAFNASGSVSLDARLKVSSLAAPVLSRDVRGAVGPGRPGLSLPLSRSAMEAFLASQTGARLQSWTDAEAAGILTIDATLAFTDGQALLSFLSGLGIPASQGESSQRRVISLEMDKAVPASVREGAKNGVPETLERLYGGWNISLKVEAPTRILSVAGGRSDGRTADFRFPTVDLVRRSSPLKWEATW